MPVGTLWCLIGPVAVGLALPAAHANPLVATVTLIACFTANSGACDSHTPMLGLGWSPAVNTYEKTYSVLFIPKVDDAYIS